MSAGTSGKASRWARAALVIAAVALAGGAAAAGRLPRLPADRPLARSDGSPGQVTFSHASHVDEARPACTGCHPRLFRILGGGTASGDAIRHDRMEKGAACGACHGKTAFGFDSCDVCHK